MYIYKVSLLDNKNFIDKIKIYSTEQENNYNNKNWYKAFKDVKNNKEYEIKKWEFLLKNYELKEYYTVDEYINTVDKIITKNSDYYLQLNIKKGLRTQYASYIPHVGITVNSPLQASLVNKI